MDISHPKMVKCGMEKNSSRQGLHPPRPQVFVFCTGTWPLRTVHQAGVWCRRWAAATSGQPDALLVTGMRVQAAGLPSCQAGMAFASQTFIRHRIASPQLGTCGSGRRHPGATVLALHVHPPHEPPSLLVSVNHEAPEPVSILLMKAMGNVALY